MKNLGQLLMLGVPANVDADFIDFIKRVQPGAFILFGRNIQTPQQLRDLIDTLRKHSSIEPIITIDQEGGRVSRLKLLGNEPPNARQLRESGNLELIRRHGELTGKLLKLFGFNLDLCPVLDIAFDEEADNSLRGRCYGKNADQVIQLAGIFNDALRSTGILSCGKHFPGYSCAPSDPHYDLSALSRPRAELEAHELRVFRHFAASQQATQQCVPGVELLTPRPLVELAHGDAVQEASSAQRGSVPDVLDRASTGATQQCAPGVELSKRSLVDSMMIGHISFAQLDNSGLPASLSPTIITKLLREEMGFSGLVMTDDLDMGAILNHYGFEETLRLGLAAGNDLLMICHRTELGEEAVRHLATFPPDQLERALQNVAHFKKKIITPDPFSYKAFRELDDQVWQLRVDTLGKKAAAERSPEDGKRSPVEIY